MEFQENLETLKQALQGEKVMSISAKHGTNLLELLNTLRSIYDEDIKKRKKAVQ